MSFSVLAVRTGDEPATELYPDPGERQDTVTLEAADGQAQVAWASSIKISAGPPSGPFRETARVRDISASVAITDQRVAIACSKYDKGGGWSGLGSGVVLAGTLNAVSRARAAHRRHGKTLVGHVRYSWLGVIEVKDRSSVGTANTLNLLLADPTGSSGIVVVSLVLDKRTPALPLGDQIARRAAHAKATATTNDDDYRQLLERYAAEPTYETPNGGGRRYRLPAPGA